VPTAYTPLAERAATPVRPGYPPGVGLGTTLHAVPFQCSVRVPPPSGDVAPICLPTAQASAGEMAVTAPIVGESGAGCAIGTTVQAVPLKWSCSASVYPAVRWDVVPTTQMSLAGVAELGWPAAGRKAVSGSVTGLQAVPFRCSSFGPLPVPAA
jgi:hypothetical protein